MEIPPELYNKPTIDLLKLMHTHPRFVNQLIKNPRTLDFFLSSKRFTGIPSALLHNTSLRASCYNTMVCVTGTVVRIGDRVFVSASEVMECVCCKNNNSVGRSSLNFKSYEENKIIEYEFNKVMKKSSSKNYKTNTLDVSSGSSGYPDDKKVHFINNKPVCAVCGSSRFEVCHDADNLVEQQELRLQDVVGNNLKFYDIVIDVKLLKTVCDKELKCESGVKIGSECGNVEQTHNKDFIDRNIIDVDSDKNIELSKKNNIVRRDFVKNNELLHRDNVLSGNSSKKTNTLNDEMFPNPYIFKNKDIKLNSGDKVNILGIVSSRLISKNDEIKTGLYIRALKITEASRHTPSQNNILIQTYQEKSNKCKYLISMFCNKIHGLSHIKLALILSLISCKSKKTNNEYTASVSSDQIIERSNIHILLIGPSACGKTTLLRSITALISPSRYVDSHSTTAVGLTACAMPDLYKNKNTGSNRNEMSYEIGTLPVCDGGLCAIDHFEGLNNVEDVLLEVMEQQTISVAKARVNVRFDAMCSIVASLSVGVKGKNGRRWKGSQKGVQKGGECLSNHKANFNKRGTNSDTQYHAVGISDSNACYCREMLSIGTPMLSRFDLVLLCDKVKGADSEIADIAFNTYGRYRNKNDRKGIHDDHTDMSETDEDLKLLINHLRYIQVDMNNDMDTENKTQNFTPIISTYYKLKQESDSAIEGPITPRLIDGLFRLACSHAKLSMRDSLVKDDIYAAILLNECSMKGERLVFFDEERVFVETEYFDEIMQIYCEILD